jgi:serine/threonine-protein kinase
MAVAPGTRLGPYEIAAQIGAGGMGEVYRATDTRLQRQVAIKVLPAEFAADPERLARFEREAQVLASLNHPHIAHIYGLERAADTTGIVMELIEGQTLADRLALAQGSGIGDRGSGIGDRGSGIGDRGSGIRDRGSGVPVDEALAIAGQIAAALEAAHERGVIHRDLKPANIKITPDGAVKVLDFGLAKMLAPAGSLSPGGREGPGEGATHSPTLSIAATAQGMILGTAAYMAPEQARGRPVDKRADIWAFGCVLYEMLSGARAFEDEDVSLTLSRVLQREPDFDALPTETPPRVRQALRVCLRKDLKQRAADIHDVRLALDGAFETVQPAAGGPAATPAVAVRWRLLPIGLALLVGAIAAGLAVWTFVPAPARRVARFAVSTPATAPLFLGGAAQARDLAISPDGTKVVYLGDGPSAPVLYVRPVDRLEATPLASSAANPEISPDGAWVLYYSTAEGLWKKVSARLDRHARTALLYRGLHRQRLEGILCLPCEEFLLALRPGRDLPLIPDP